MTAYQFIAWIAEVYLLTLLVVGVGLIIIGILLTVIIQKKGRDEE